MGRRIGSSRRDAAWLLASGAGQASIAFAANLVLVRCIAPEGFGRFAIAYAAVTAVLSIASLRTGALVVRCKELDPSARERYWNALFSETVVGGAIAAAALSAASDAGWLGWFLLAGCLAKHVATNARGFLERRSAWRRLAAIEGGVQFLGHGLAVGLAVGGADVAALVLREVAIGAASVVLVALAGGFPRSRPRFLTLAQWRRTIGEARELWLDGALEGLHMRAIVLAAGLVGGERAAGLVSQAHRLATVPHQLLAPVAGRLAFAWFSRRADAGALRRRLARALLLVLAPAALGALTLSHLVVPLVFGSGWDEVAPLLAAMSGVVLGTSLLSLVKMQLQAERAVLALLVTRAVQFVALGAGLLVALSAGGSLTPFAVGLSAGALLAAAMGWIALERRPAAAQDARVDLPAAAMPARRPRESATALQR